MEMVEEEVWGRAGPETPKGLEKELPMLYRGCIFLWCSHCGGSTWHEPRENHQGRRPRSKRGSTYRRKTYACMNCGGEVRL